MEYIKDFKLSEQLHLDKPENDNDYKTYLNNSDVLSSARHVLGFLIENGYIKKNMLKRAEHHYVELREVQNANYSKYTEIMNNLLNRK